MEEKPPACAAAKPPETNWKSMSIGQKCCLIVKNITLEPIMILFIMPSVLASLATQNLNLEKACRVNLALANETCDALTARNTTGLEEEERQVQQLVAGMQTWKTVLQSAIPTVLILFMGAWSDRTRLRKPCILLPLFGEFLASLSLIACTFWFYEFSMEATGFAEAFWPAITGGWFTMFMGVFSYMGDITSIDSRTLRIGVVNVTIYLSVPIGMALSGIVYIKLGFYGVFIISSTCYLIGLSYGIFYLKEAPDAQQPQLEKEDRAKVSIWKSFVDFFSIKHIFETFRVTFKKTANKRRQKLRVLMIVNMVIIGPMHGEMAVMYLFARYRFGWNEMKFSIFSTYSMVTNLIGVTICIGVFSQIFKLDDALIGVISSLGKIAGSLVYAFAYTDWMIYMAPLAEITQGASTIAMRAIISKMIPSDELGQVNSLYGVCESLMPLVYGPMYSAVYRATMKTFPGAFFIVGGSLTIPAVIGFIWLYMERDVEDKGKSGKTELAESGKMSTKVTSSREKPIESSMIAGIVNAAFESDKS